ncbi:MAG: sporulation transcription factor Spo0A [Clostridium sp.]|nr:sporulation transcription factor Spo0A [Clostridium sp.]
MTKRIKVLVAENDSDRSSSLKREFLNYPEIEIVGTAKDGIETLDIIEKLAPEVLILDIIMPKLDGISVLERLKSKEKDTKTIVYSAISNKNIINAALSLGADYYVIRETNNLVDEVRGLVTKIKILTSNATLISENFGMESFYEVKGTVKSKNELVQEISYLLQKAGIPPHVKGYQYLRMCIYEAMVNMEILSAITKELYPKVAERYSTTPSGVERAIRHSLEIAWGKGTVLEMFKEENISYNSSSKKPTNKEFILLISEKMRLNSI